MLIIILIISLIIVLIIIIIIILMIRGWPFYKVILEKEKVSAKSKLTFIVVITVNMLTRTKKASRHIMTPNTRKIPATRPMLILRLPWS